MTPMSHGPIKKKVRKEPVPGGDTKTTPQGKVHVVIPVSGELKKSAQSFVAHLKGLAEPDDFGLMVHVFVAPGETGRKELATISLLQCANREYVRKKREGFENFTWENKHLVPLLGREPNRDCWSDVITSLKGSRTSSVKNHAQSIAKLLEKQDQKRKSLIKVLRSLHREAEDLPANFQAVYKTIQKLEEAEESRRQDMLEVWNTLHSLAHTFDKLPKTSTSVVLEECKPWLSPAPASMDNESANVPLLAFFGRLLVGVVNDISQIRNPEVTEWPIERVALEFAELWIKNINRNR